MTYQPNGSPSGSGNSEAQWAAKDHAERVRNFKVALAIFVGLTALSVFLLVVAHIVFVPFLAIIMGIRAAVIGWHAFGKGGNANRARVPSSGPWPQQQAPTNWQQQPPVPQAAAAPPAPPPPPPAAPIPPPPPPPGFYPPAPQPQQPPSDGAPWNI